MELETMSISDLLALRTVLEEKRKHYYTQHNGAAKCEEMAKKINRVDNILNQIIELLD
jgi:hypothetical protein